jgi:hypothetical protein
MTIITRRSLIVSGAAAVAGLGAGAAEAATGSVTLKIFSAGFLLGASGGDGSLLFNGQQYLLSVGGVSAGAIIGVSAADLVGSASGLKTASDVEGIYTAVGAGLAVAGGGKTARLRNAKGVTLSLHGRQIGFMFSIDLSGMSISLK